MSDAVTITQVEPFPQQQRNNSIADELGKLIDLLRSEFPSAIKIFFEFDDRLKVHIDVRTGEEIGTTETKLARLCGGTFTQVTHGGTPHHPFFHRITAKVER
jgi:hypothetical protein